MKNLIHTKWLSATAKERFQFLALLDNMYGEGKGINGHGLGILKQCYETRVKQLKEQIKEVNECGCVDGGHECARDVGNISIRDDGVDSL